MKQQFKYYKDGVHFFQVGYERHIHVHAVEKYPDIISGQKDGLMSAWPDLKPITMKEFEEAYLWTRHQLDKQALQSRKMKEVQS